MNALLVKVNAKLTFSNCLREVLHGMFISQFCGKRCMHEANYPSMTIYEVKSRLCTIGGQSLPLTHDCVLIFLIGLK